MLEADGAGDLGQGVFGQAVGGGAVIDEEDRTAEHGAGESAARFAFGAALDLADEVGQQHPEGQGAPAHFGLAIDQAGTEQALERAHEPPFVAGQIAGQRGAAVADLVVLGIEEHDGRQGGFAVFQCEQGGLAGAYPAYCGV